MTGERRLIMCAHVGIGSHRCAASWEVEEGIRTVSLRHLVQHRQKLNSMSWLEERKRKKKRREERRGESDHYVTDAGNQRHRGRDPWKKKKKKHGVTSHLYHTGSITLQSPLPSLDNTASIPWQPLIDLSLESCWGKRNWKRWGGNEGGDEAGEVVTARRKRLQR